jgi:hypothetical protein
LVASKIEPNYLEHTRETLINRLQGIVVNLSWVPSFRRRFINLVKALYLEAVEVGAIDGSRSVKRKIEADAAPAPGSKFDDKDGDGSSNDAAAVGIDAV